ncbi:MAG: cation:proton antiporter [Steroidobacteraceae bacterium]
MELLYILLVLLVVTRVCGEIAERANQPALAGELIAGIALGIVVAQNASSFPVLAELSGNEVFTAITDLAIFFLMLNAGVELKPRQLAASSRSALLVAIGGFVVPLTAGFALGWILLPTSSLRLVQSLFIGTALAITAVPVAVKVLMDLGKLNSKPGQMIVSAALFDDVLSLVLLAVLLAVIRTGELPSTFEVLTIIGNVAAFFAITIGIGLFAIPRIGHLLGKATVAEFEFSALLVYALGYAFLAERFGLHFIVGAFVAGLFFNRTTVDNNFYEGVKARVSGITSGFLAPVFFASIGLHLDIAALSQVPAFLALLVIVALAGKLLGSGGVAYWLGMGARNSTAIGIAMSGRGAVELVIADIALRGGVFQLPVPPPPIVANLFSAVVIVAVITTLFTPIALRWILAKD